jgi:hypothetical protein
MRFACVGMTAPHIAPKRIRHPLAADKLSDEKSFRRCRRRFWRRWRVDRGRERLWFALQRSSLRASARLRLSIRRAN